ncbi:oligosaccharide repeat unit polymerase [Mucilaginibacter corticis]|uniref:Oligosaccharide repeat unit polymerase n=1 Tax=Mucilaginibacter corticis TaxID=2597670 RepID=A0A556M8Z4_9SPHI|nr:oligosaccharide repeat unit polymerase [Mucilaginibacter corticis]TSJ36397.1 oligosaccharide repeat unit polymerase [Mucilaginibacter corticis]
MDWYAFGLLLYEHLPLYLLILAGALLLYYFIFKTTYLSLLDPLIFNLLYSVFGFSVVIFLYATQSMDIKYLYSYLLTQLAFFGGLFCFAPLNTRQLVDLDSGNAVFEEEGMFVKILFFITSGSYVLIQLLSYKLVGIPLFMESRTGAYADSGGLGILGRIIDVLRPVVIFLLIYLLFKKSNSLKLNFYLAGFGLFLLTSLILSGSKSLFMNIGFVLFIYLILNAGKHSGSFFNLRKYERYLIICGLLLAFLTIFIQSQQNNPGEQNSLGIFLYRLVASGDTYYFSYPSHNIETIDGSKGFLALFGDIFSVLRIVPRENQPGVLGVQLFQLYSDSDLITGPNARHNVFGYVYYGFYGSIVFSFLIGWSLSFARNKLLFVLKRNIIGQLAFLFLYLNLTFIETDPPVAVSGLENALLIFPVFLVIALLLYVPLFDFKSRFFSLKILK